MTSFLRPWIWGICCIFSGSPPETQAAVAWASALAGFWLPWWVIVGAAVVIACWVLVRRPGAVQVAWLLLAVTAACGAAVRVDAVRGGPVAALAHDQAAVVAVVELTSDPSVRHGRFGDYVIARADVTQIRCVGSMVSQLRAGLQVWNGMLGRSNSR